MNKEAITGPIKTIASKLAWKTMPTPQAVYKEYARWSEATGWELKIISTLVPYGVPLFIFEKELIDTSTLDVYGAYNVAFGRFKNEVTSLQEKRKSGRILSDVEKGVIRQFGTIRRNRDHITRGQPVSSGFGEDLNRIQTGKLIDFLGSRIVRLKQLASSTIFLGKEEREEPIKQYEKIQEILLKNSSPGHRLISPKIEPTVDAPSWNQLRRAARTEQTVYREDQRRQRSRLRWWPYAVLASTILALALLGRDKSAKSSLVEEPVSPDSGAASEPADETSKKLEQKILKIHRYTNQPDANGVYGSAWGHADYELAKVLDPTLVEDERAQGKPVDADDERIEKVLSEFRSTNLEDYEKIIRVYIDSIRKNSPGAVRGEDDLVSREFSSQPMAEVYEEVRTEALTVQGWVN